MNKEFGVFKDSKEFLLQKIKSGIWFSPLNLKQLAKMKQKLLKYSESDIRTFRASINASYSKYSNFAPMGIFLTILFSGCFTVLSSFAMACINFGTSIYMDFLRGSYHSEENVSSQFKEQLLRDFSGKSVNDVFQKVFLDNIGGYFQLFGYFLLIILIVILIYYFRLNTISKLKFLLDEVLDEKIRMEERKISNLYSSKSG